MSCRHLLSIDCWESCKQAPALSKDVEMLHPQSVLELHSAVLERMEAQCRLCVHAKDEEMAAYVRVLQHEFPAWKVTCIVGDDAPEGTSENVEEREWAWRAGTWTMRRAQWWDPVSPVRTGRGQRVVAEEGCYIISGGLGYLGRLVARALIEQGARHLVLLSSSRSELPEDWELEMLPAASKNGGFISKMLNNLEPHSLYLQLVEAGRALGKVVGDDEDDALATEDDSNAPAAYAASMRSMSGRFEISKRAPRFSAGQEGAASSVSARKVYFAKALQLSQGYETTVEKAMFGVYFLMKALVEYDSGGSLDERLQMLAAKHHPLAEYLAHHTSNVEISHTRTGQKSVEVVHFRVSPEVRALTLGRGFRIGTEAEMFDVPRENPQEKAKAFVRKLHRIRRSIHWLLFVGRHPAARFAIRHRSRLAHAPLALAALITLCLLLFYGIPVDPNTGGILADGIFHTFSTVKVPAGYGYTSYPFPERTSDPEGTGARYGTIMMATDLAVKFRLSLQSRWESSLEWELFPAGRGILWALGLLHLLAATLNAVITMLVDLPLAIQDVTDKYTHLPGGTPASGMSGGGGEGGGQRRVLRGAAYLEEEGEVPAVASIEWRSSLVVDLLAACRVSVYDAALVALSLLGLISSPLFFVFLTLDFLRTRGGRLVLAAVVHGAPNLLRSFVLGVIVIVCLGFYSYAYFSQTININQELCHSPFQCVAKHILDSMTGDLTTVLGDDFGNFGFPSLAVWKDAWNSWRSLFVFCSIVFWVFLLQGIIQGQIIDAFAEKRNLDFYLKEDLEQKCFVSSIHRFVFNAFPGEWEKRRGGQYAWNYLLFLTYLTEKPEKDKNGLENYVSQAFERGDVGFLPIEQLAARQRGEALAEEKDGVRVMVERMESLVSRVERMEGLLPRMAQVESDVGAVRLATSAILQALSGARGSRHAHRRSSDASQGAGGAELHRFISVHDLPQWPASDADSGALHRISGAFSPVEEKRPAGQA